MNKKLVTRSTHRLFSIILLVSLLFSNFWGNSVSSVNAQVLESDNFTQRATSDSLTKDEMAFLITKDLAEYGQTLPDDYSILVDHGDTQDQWMVIAYYLTYAGDAAGGEAIGLAQLENSKWHVISYANPIFIDWLSKLPTSLLNEDAKLHFGTPQSQLSQITTLSAYSGHRLPWQGGISHQVTTGVGGHSSPVEYWAYDFGVANGTEIWASYSGTVAYVTDPYGSGACDPNLANQGNRVVVNNDDGSASLYLHLQQNGARVLVGQHVNQGDLIGLSGNSGYVCPTGSGYHLHFQVQLQGASWWTQSQQIIFDPNGEPALNSWPISGNYRGSSGSLNPPTLLSPSQGQTLTSRSVHLTWQSPNATNQSGYTFRLSTSSNPDTIQSGFPDTGLGNEYTSYDFNFSSDGTFYWHMRTWNSSNQASSWVTRSFVINTSGGGGNNPPAGFTWCADEDGHCNFSGTADVVYGAINSFTSPRSFNNGVDCNNTIFGDPISGTRKACYYKASVPPSGNMHVEYFNDKNLGSRCSETYENSTYVFKNWGNGSPAGGCNSDNFSARFTGTYNFSGGSYSFHCQHDDGCRIFIDGQEKLNAWWDSSFTGHDWGGTLSGSHEVKIEFYDSGGDARLEAFWSGAGFLPTGPSCTSGEWCAQYFGNKDLSGTPAISRNEGNTNIDYTWNDGGIGYGFPNDAFSVRWQRNVYYAAGRYRFHIRTDDGGRLWVNNNLVIDQWKDQGATEYTFDLDLGAGEVPLKFEYYEGGGGAIAQMWWDTLQLYTDDATFITQSPYLTVNPGDNFQIYFEVRNIGTTTWQPDSYWLENLQYPLGANTQQSLSQSVPPNGTYRWTINETAPTTPGTYRSQWMISHNGSVFGPNMFIDVTVTGKPDLIPYPLDGRQDPIIISPVGGTSTNGTIYAGQSIYIDWGYNNIGNVDINSNYYVDLYIDDQRVIHYPFTWLCVGCVGGFDDWQEAWSASGWHTVKLVVDPDNTIDESNEGNNIWTKDFYWEPIFLTLTVNKAGTGSGTVTSSPAGINCGATCSYAFAYNTAVTLTAAPTAPATFTDWSGGGCSGTGTCTVTMSAAQAVTANFTAPGNQTLTVTKAGTGSGTVTSSPAGINCGTTCSYAFAYNASVTLTASAATGSTFTGWSGACTGTGACIVSMTAAKSVTATFTITPTYHLMLDIFGTGSGSVTGPGINCPGDCSEDYVSGASITLIATPISGSKFSNWVGDCTGTGTSCTLTMTTGMFVTAMFTINPTYYPLTVSTTGTGNGTVTGTGINCPGDCSESYVSGTSVTLTANTVTGSTFTGWIGACSGTGTCLMTMDADKTVTANFNALGVTLISPEGLLTSWNNTFTWMGFTGVTWYLVEVQAADDTVILQKWYTADSVGCSGDLSCAVSPEETLTLANGDYHWRILDYGDYGYGSWTPYTNFNLNAACYALTTDVLQAGSGTFHATAQNCSGGYIAGTVVQLTAVPNSGYAFVSWSGDATSTSNPVSVTMDADKSVVANFTTLGATLIAPAGEQTGWNNTFSWTGINGASWYLVQAQAADDSVVLQKWYTADAAGCSGDLSCAVSPEETLNLSNGDYKWRILDYGNYGYGSWTPYTNFNLNAACYTLTTNVLPAGSGTFHATAQNCSGGYISGTVVQLTAVPNSGYAFVSWSGDVAGTANPVSIVMDANKNVTANMMGLGATLIVPAGALTSWDNTFSWTGVTGATWYLVQVQAADDSVILQKWYTVDAAGCAGDLSCAVSPEETLTLANGDYKWRILDYGDYGYGSWSVYKDFSLNTACYALTTDVLPMGSGTVTASSQNCSGGYIAGTVVQVSVVPNSGYAFTSWSGGANGITNPVSITMDGNKSVTANLTALGATLIAPVGSLTTWDNTFSWTGFSTASWYLVQIQSLDDNTVILQQWYTADVAGCAGGTACVIVPPETASLANGDYQWRILDYGDYGYGNWSPYTTFSLNR